MVAGSPVNSQQAQPVRVAAAKLSLFVAELFGRAGTPEAASHVVAQHLVESNQSGHDSHGVIRVPFYLDMIEAGELLPGALPRTVVKEDATALVSGEWGFGQLASYYATDIVVELAGRFGVGAVGVIRCTHIGRLGAYAERAAAHDVALLMFVGGFGKGHNAAPYGGARGVLGGNPIAGSFPGTDETLLVDFATAGVAAGKVLVAAAQNEKLAPGLIIDRDGRPTTDPKDFLAGGALLPFGGHKGYGLAVLCELLGQTLTGSGNIEDGIEGGSMFRRSGALLVGIRTDAFRERAAARAAASALAATLRAIPPAPGFDRVFAPGDPEAITREKRSETFALPAATWAELELAAQKLGVATPPDALVPAA